MERQDRADPDDDAVSLARFLDMDGRKPAIREFGEMHGFARLLRQFPHELRRGLEEGVAVFPDAREPEQRRAEPVFARVGLLLDKTVLFQLDEETPSRRLGRPRW